MTSPSLFEFQQFDMEKQIEWLTSHGTYMAWKSEGEYNVYLYNLDNFFAEAWMHIRMSKIMRVSCTKNSNIPEGYDKSIKID